MNDQAKKRLKKIFAQAWRIYDDHRLLLLYCKYFEAKVTRLQTTILGLDILIIVGTSTTGIAGWKLWNDPSLHVIWLGIAGLATTFAGLKPVLRLDDKLVRYTKLFGEYGRVVDGYDNLVKDIKSNQSLSNDVPQRRAELERARSGLERIPLRPKRLVERLQDEVDKEWPVTNYWSPTSVKGRTR